MSWMKKFQKSPWAICVVGAILGFIFSLIHDCISGQQVFSTIYLFLKGVCNYVIGCLTATFHITVWQMLLGVAVIIALKIVVKRVTQQWSSVKPDNSPEFTTYTTDYFQHWKWSWIWVKDPYEQTWGVKNLRAHCPKCDTMMLHDGCGYFWCPRCAFKPNYRDCDDLQDVKAVIYDNVNREIYKT